MNKEVLKKSLDWVEKVGVKHPPLFLHVFGEPLLFKEFEDYAKEFSKLVSVSFSTNCTYIDSKRADRLAEIDWAWISLSPWKMEDVERSYRLLDERGIKIMYPRGVTHDWASQAEGPIIGSTFKCHFLVEKEAVIRWDGSIANCCISDREEDKIGHVDQNPSEINMRLYSICKSCHHWIPSETLRELEEVQ